MTSIVVALVSFAVALCLGWILCKAYFRTQMAVGHVGLEDHEEMRKRYRKRLKIMHKLVKRHESTQQQIKGMIAEIQKARAEKVAPGDGATDAGNTPSDTQSQLSKLLINVSERDDEIIDLQTQIAQLESEPKSAGETAVVDADSIARAADPDAELAAMRAELSSRERQADEFQRELSERETEFQELRATLDSWKQRVNPLTEKLKQQRDTIRELQDNVGEEA